jgi:hypothetical protein
MKEYTMKKSQVLFLVISISALILIGKDVIDRPGFQKLAHAKSTSSSEKPNWEYCALSGTGLYRKDLGSTIFYTTIRYYHPSGWRTETIEMTDYGEGPYDEKVVAKAIAKLGSEGWEIAIDRSREGTTSWIYFKRPKQ